MKIKICGLRDPVNIRAVAAIHPDFMGFVFCPGSKRFSGNLSADVMRSIPGHILKIGVFVNASILQVLNIANRYDLDGVQLHGDECPEFCRALKNTGLIVIKAFAVDNPDDFSTTAVYSNSCHYLLFDSKSPQRGGSGRHFRWSLLRHYRGNMPFFLSGGIGPEDGDALQRYHGPVPFAVDLNSRFEQRPGFKDIQLLRSAMNDFIPLNKEEKA